MGKNEQNEALVFSTWDSAGRSPDQFQGFAAEILTGFQCGSGETLTEEQAKVLAEIIDSFVDGAEEKHHKFMGSADPDSAAISDFDRESSIMPYRSVREELERDKEAFKGLTDEDIKNEIATGNRFFRWIKYKLLHMEDSRMLDELRPFLGEDNAKAAIELFSNQAQMVPTHQKAMLPQDNPPAEDLDKWRSRELVAQGLRLGNVALAVRESTSSSKDSSDAPKCVSDGIWSDLLSPEETLLKKLFALAALPNLLKRKDADIESLPFLAIFAAKTAVESVTDIKTTFQLDCLEQAARAFLAPVNDEGKKVR